MSDQEMTEVKTQTSLEQADSLSLGPGPSVKLPEPGLQVL